MDIRGAIAEGVWRVTVGPLVSVIVPVRDGEAYLGDTLRSLALQFEDPSHIQVIVLDDGSRDATPALCREAARSLPGLCYLRNDEPVGAWRSRNRGLELAEGAMIAFLDADDWFAPGRLSVLADRMRELDCDFIRTDLVLTSGAERSVKQAPQARRGIVLDPRDGVLPVDAYTMVDHPWTQAGLYSRRLLDAGILGFPDVDATAQDRPWIWRLHLQADSYAVVDAPAFHWRKGVETSLTSVLDARRLGFLSAMTRVRDIVAADRDAERFAPKVVQATFGLLDHHLGFTGRLSEEVRDTMVREARHLIASFPSDVVRERVDALGDERRTRLKPVLKGLVSDRSHS